MKGRESGMPEQDQWEQFFDAEEVISRLGCADLVGDVVEFGCGYGTFTLPVAAKLAGRVQALDMENAMITATAEKARVGGFSNVQTILRDFVEQGTGLADGSVVHAMLFNFLHIEDPVGLLREVHRVLSPSGTASVIHWRIDIETPRGPSLEIRPSPGQCIRWAAGAGFRKARQVALGESAPWHFGMVFEKRAD